MNETAISQVDTLFRSGIYPIEFLFYYQNGLEILSLRKALKKISSSFWPVFGQLESGSITFDKYKEEDFFDEETLHRDFFLPESEEDRFKAFSPLRLPDLNTLFFVKVLNFKNGTVLIPKMNHLAGDGYSYFYFLSVLSELTQTKNKAFPSSFSQIFTKPHHRRTSLKDFAFEHVEQAPLKQYKNFTIEHMEFPKNELSSQLRGMSSFGLRISTNDVLSAMALKKTVSLKGTEFGDRIRLTIPIDVRRKVKSYGPRFFGNGILLHTAVFERKQIENLDRERIAAQIRKSMPSLSSEVYRDYLMSLEHLLSTGEQEDIRPFDPRYGCLVTNLSRMPTDKLNFGSGFPKLVYPLTVEKNSAVVLSKGENYVLRLAY